MDRLKRQLDDINVTYTEKIFETENGIAELGTEPFVSHINHSILQSSNEGLHLTKDQRIQLASYMKFLPGKIIPYIETIGISPRYSTMKCMHASYNPAICQVPY